MEEAYQEKTEEVAQPVETEEISGDKKTEVSLGKFKDVQALLNAYNSLQSEFTKRCQRLKELEGTVANKQSELVATEGESAERNEASNTLIKEEYLKDYLKGVMNSKQKAIVMNETGVGVKTPVNKPKTIAEAGMLAKEIL